MGTGPNGLAAAVALAQAGRSVVVFEAAATVGGGARTAELTLPGFRHDICSAIHPMAIASPFLRSLPLEEHGLDWVHPDAPLAHPLDDGSAVLLLRSVEETAKTLGEDAARYPRWIGGFVEHWVDLAADAMGPLRVPRHPIRLARLARFGLRGLRSAAGLARSTFRGEAARALLAGLAAHSVLPLERIPSAAIGLMLGIAGHATGWPMPRGGSQAISDALASLLRSLGGEIVTGVRISSLRELPSSGPLLFDVPPVELARIAGDALPAGYRRRLGRFRHGPGVFKIDWALDGPIPWRAAECARAGTVHLGGTLDEIAAGERAVWQGRHSETPYVLVAQQSLFDPTRAPEGRHTGWAYCHVPSGSTRDRTDVIESQMERYAPGFRDRVLGRHVMNTADLARYNSNYIGGDINGGVSDLGQLFFRPTLRLVPYRTPNPRIFLCSASTPPGGGVHGLGGYYAARAALR
ncbi:MAG: NAD(P)/FAD-dependent oxidoreductase [Proteobacteria bacterium]|nr:NAD(P)/FAD-dependent oxidoreductase [Pseudomonadota bacterium]